MVYDFILSFPAELEWIWRRNLRAGKVLYPSLRYVPIVFVAIEALTGMSVIRDLIVSVELQYEMLRFQGNSRGKNDQSFT